MPTAAHKQLCARMMAPDSDRLARIWEMLVDETDAKILLAMPGTVSTLAQATGLDEPDVAARVRGMFRRGVAFESTKPEGTIYRPPKHFVQFHDASAQWPEAPPEFLDLMREFMHEEYPAFVGLLVAAGFPAFMRAVPSPDLAEKTAGVRPFEDLAAIIRGADKLGVCNCPCRVVERNCDAELETCIQIGKGADYVVARGTGRAITADEALAILRKADADGLVHCVDNSRSRMTFVCNCCNDCCAVMKPGLDNPEHRSILAPSRFRVEIDSSACIGDGLCAHVCPVGAVTMADDNFDTAILMPDRCIGCGLCVLECTTDALYLKEFAPPESIPE